MKSDDTSVGPSGSVTAGACGTAGESDDGLTLRTVESETDFAALRDDWQRLARGDDRSGVFNGWAWNRCWWAHYGDLGELHVLVFEAGGRVRGIAPFYHTRSRILRFAELSTLRFLGSGGDTSPDDLDLVVEPDWRERVAEACARHLLSETAFTRFDLTDLPEESVFLGAMRREWERVGIVAPGMRRLTRAVDRLPARVSDWQAGQSRNARKQLKRRRNRLADTGTATFSRCTTPADVATAHAALVDLHRQRRGSLGDGGGFRSERYVAFHLDLMQCLLERDELRLCMLSIDDAPVAAEYAFERHGTLAFFQSGFDPAYAAIAPAHLLMHHMIEEAIERGVQRIDLLKGDYEYKRAFASGTRSTVAIDVLVSAPLAHAVSALRRLVAFTRR